MPTYRETDQTKVELGSEATRLAAALADRLDPYRRREVSFGSRIGPSWLNAARAALEVLHGTRPCTCPDGAWCIVHGNCTCTLERDGEQLLTESCPIHASTLAEAGV